MKFELKHTFPCTPAQMWEITESEEFEQRLAQASQAQRKLQEQRDDGNTRYIRRTVIANRQLPGPIVKVLGTDQIAYDQESWRPLDHSGPQRWKIAPQVLQGRFEGAGQTLVRETPTGCERIISGEFNIRVPLLGGQMEKRLVDDVSASYDRAAQVILDLLRARG